MVYERELTTLRPLTNDLMVAYSMGNVENLRVLASGEGVDPDLLRTATRLARGFALKLRGNLPEEQRLVDFSCNVARRRLASIGRQDVVASLSMLVLVSPKTP